MSRLPAVTFQYNPPVTPRGPADAKILVVGEAPGQNEMEAGKPFVGSSGHELENMLLEAGIDPETVRYTNVCGYRPDRNNIEEFFYSSKKKSVEGGGIGYNGRYCKPIVLAGVHELREEIRRVQPNIVIACGNTGLWATTGEWGITSWRGSQMWGGIDDVEFKVIPIIHPAGILRNWGWRWHTIIDLRRAERESHDRQLRTPEWDFLIRPSYSDVVNYLVRLYRQTRRRPTRLAVDIETRVSHVACVGLARNSLEAICIPFMCVEDPDGYWTKHEEANIWYLLYRLLSHKNCLVVGQNFLYDNQYFIRRAGFKCNLVDDTMMKMHVCFPGVPKSLAFISSIFCDFHCYWKDDGKEWEKNMDEEQLWIYNCRDAVATFESNEELDKLLDAFNLRHLYDERMAVSNEVAMPMMLRGVAASFVQKQELYIACTKAINQRKDFLMDVLGFDIFGPKGGVSPPKMKMLCYDLFQLPPKYRVDPKTKRRALSCDKDAIDEWLLTCNIFYRPILKMIKDIRSISVFRNTFAAAPLDWDGRWRCSLNVAGPHTFRWSASEDAFGYGANLQTIPKGDER